MKEVIMWECDCCHIRYSTKEECEACEQKHDGVFKANEMLRNGNTLGEINEKYNIWGSDLPLKLDSASITTAFTRGTPKKRTCAGRVIVGISDDGRLYTSKVSTSLRKTSSYTVNNFVGIFVPNQEESEYMEFLYNKYGVELFKEMC